MLKIKDEIHLVSLVKYGFIRKDDNTFCKKVYLYNENDDVNFYEIDIKTRIIKLSRLDGELDNTLFDLINDGLVEKVYSGKKVSSLLDRYINECRNADNSCRQEKLGCKGCYHNEKQKIIEIYYTPQKNGDYDIDCERVIDNDVSNALMKRILHCLVEGEF